MRDELIKLDRYQKQFKFLYKNNTIKNISFPCVLRVGNDFLSKNKVIESLSMLNLIQVGDSYLYDNRII
jgi:hypothetical protein